LRAACAEYEKAYRSIVAYSGLPHNKMDLFQMSGLLYDLFNVEVGTLDANHNDYFDI
jgi:hypothetical protein